MDREDAQTHVHTLWPSHVCFPSVQAASKLQDETQTKGDKSIKLNTRQEPDALVHAAPWS